MTAERGSHTRGIQDMMPDGWKSYKLNRVVRIANGQVSPADSRYCDCYYLGPENIESHSGRIVGLRTVANMGLTSGKYAFDARSLVYCKIRPYLNKVCCPDFNGVCSADAYPMWPRDDVLTREYLFYFMLSQWFVKKAVQVSMRTGFPKINRQDLGNISVVVPPLPEQRAIANVLSTWDRAIEQTSRLIEAKKKLKQGLMQQLLTGKRRFAEFEGQQWRTTALGQVFKERTEAGREDLPLLAVTANHGVIDRDDLVKRDTSSSDKSKYKRVVPGDIAYNTMRMWQGRSALSDKDGIVSPAYTVCIPQDGTDGRYAEHLFQLPEVIYEFRRYSQGLVDDTLNLKFPEFAKIKLAFPCETEQRRIADVLDAITKEISLHERRLEAVGRQKKGLMQKLLTGQLRVKV